VDLKDYRRIIKEFNDDWDNYFIVDVTKPLVRRAGQLAEKHGLRGYDAIQLSSALLMHEESRQVVSFCCFDERLLRAGRREGLKPVF
jgi:predicted nucleic acid-binding protein